MKDNEGYSMFLNLNVLGQSVMRVQAEDYDEGVNAQFSFQMIGQGNPSTAFRIEPDSGIVHTTIGTLDREMYSQYTFVVMATDKGTPQAQSSTATVTINLIDINDNPPVFNQTVYKETIPETHSGQILKIKAYDPDVDETLRYSLNKEAYAHFTIDTQGREGIIGVYNGSVSCLIVLFIMFIKKQRGVGGSTFVSSRKKL